MERKDVLIPEAELVRQREFELKIKEMFAQREAHPVACIDTFGCQQNVADGQKLMGMLEVMGFTFTDKPVEADVVILNTCAVREHAEDRVFGNLGALSHGKKANPNQIIVNGINKQMVGEIAAQIRSKRPPEPYLGKGVKYVDEVIRRKSGKAGK